MNRTLGLVVAMMLALTGCAQVMPMAEWTQVKVSYTAGSAPGQLGNYMVVITPKQATFTGDDGTSTRELPPGAWDSVVTAARALGARDGEPCPGGEAIWVAAGTEKETLQKFTASSCDDGELISKAKSVASGVLSLFR